MNDRQITPDYLVIVDGHAYTFFNIQQAKSCAFPNGQIFKVDRRTGVLNYNPLKR